MSTLPAQAVSTSLLVAATLLACTPPPPTRLPPPPDAGVLSFCGAVSEDLSACARPATDYQPQARDAGASGWPACPSDDGMFRFGSPNIPAAAARVRAYDAMGARLWNNPNEPTPDDFTAARLEYSTMNGLASRVARRQDVTEPELPLMDKFACQSDPAIAASAPDRCAGPARLKPIIDEAFVQGTAGTEPRVQAARIEASLLFFMHLSMLSEVWTCSFDSLTDCDAAMGYYSAEPVPSMTSGYSTLVSRLTPSTHLAIYDALLGVRCWRDTDKQLPAQRTDLYERAASQMRRASSRGLAGVLRERMRRLSCAQGGERDAARAFVSTLGSLFHRQLRAANAAAADEVRAFTQAPVSDDAAIARAVAALDRTVPCP